MLIQSAGLPPLPAAGGSAGARACTR